MAYFAICQRLYENAGRQQNKTYVDVVESVRETTESFDDLAQNHPVWSNPAENEYIIEIPFGVYNAINSGSEPLFHDNLRNLPKWQQETQGSGSTMSFGSYADPQDDQTAFTAETPIPDDRLIVRIFDDDPTGSGVHIAEEALEEELVTGFVVRYLKLYTQDDVPSTSNAQDQKT